MRKYSIILIFILLIIKSSFGQDNCGGFSNHNTMFYFFSVGEYYDVYKDHINIITYNLSDNDQSDSHIFFSYKKCPDTKIRIGRSKISENTYRRTYNVLVNNSNKKEYESIINTIDSIEFSFGDNKNKYKLQIINNTGQRIYKSEPGGIILFCFYNEKDRKIVYSFNARFSE